MGGMGHGHGGHLTATRKYWEIIADNLSKAGWSWGCVSTVDSSGRTQSKASSNRRSVNRDMRDLELDFFLNFGGHPG